MDAQGNFDDMFSQMLGELDVLTQQLDADPASSVPPPAERRAPPLIATKPIPSTQEDVDLSSMLDDLCSFESNLVNTDSIDGILTSSNSVSQDSGIGVRTDSLPRNNYLTVDDGHQKFDTLKRSGARNVGYTSSAYDEEDDDELSLDALSKDLDVENKQAKFQALTEEELSTLSPVLHELDDIVQTLTGVAEPASGQKKDSVRKSMENNSPSNSNHSSCREKLKPNEVKMNNSSLEKGVITKPTPPPISKKPKVSFKMKDLHPVITDEAHLEDQNLLKSNTTNMISKEHSNETTVDMPTEFQKKAPAIHSGAIDEHSKQTYSESAKKNSENTLRCEMPTNLNLGYLQKEGRTMSIKSIESDSSSVASSKTDDLESNFIEKIESRLNALGSMDENQMSAEEQEERIKSEKMRIALEKMKEARIQKLVVKVYNKDESSKTLMIDERMAVRGVMKQLIEKNHFDYSPNWALIEEIPSLYMERMYEEHEKPCDFMSYWTRDTTNQLRFVERKDKYALFKNPQHYLLSHSDNQDQMLERQKQTLLEEFFSGKGPSSGVPEVEGYLHIKGDGKSWNRKYCVLRSSGLYASKSGEPKKGKKLADLVCIIMFDQCMLYLGRGWKKKYKSPYEYGFALKHPAIQVKSKHIRYLCCEDFKSLMRWSVGIRLAKYGRQLLDNYEKTNEEIRSTSIASTPFTFRQQTQQQQPDNLSIRSGDSGGSGSRSNTLPRGVGVKNIFEGAWQRANQEEKSDSVEASPSSTNISRGKSVWKPNTKKSNNWWELQDQEQEEEAPEPPHMQRRFNEPEERFSGSTAAPVPPPPPAGNKPSAYQEVEYDTDLPPPPMPNMDTGYPLPPPQDNFMPPPAPSTYSPAHNQMPPPPPMKMGVFSPPKPPVKPGNTFMSYDDLPPPPPPNDSSYLPPPPPPVPGPKPGTKPAPPVAPKRMPPRPQYNYSNNNNKLKPCVSHESLEEDPPSFHPPPPTKSSISAAKYVHSGNADFSSPLNYYYETQQSTQNFQQNSYSIDDFPPPPPFIFDLKDSFEAVGNEATIIEHQTTADSLPPKPHSLLSYIKRKSAPKPRQQEFKKKPSPPQRNAATKLSKKSK